MKVRSVSPILLMGLLMAGAAGAQTAPAANDPHHPAGSEATTAPVEGNVAAQPASPGGAAGMGAMMSPDMMQMMMQMMAQHHPAGQTPMAGMAGGMQSGMATGSGPEAILGLAPTATPEMTPDKVQAWLQDRLDLLGNPRLVLGTIGDASDGSITAEIRTVDGALVQKLAFNRFPGFVRQID